MKIDKNDFNVSNFLFCTACFEDFLIVLIKSKTKVDSVMLSHPPFRDLMSIIKFSSLSCLLVFVLYFLFYLTNNTLFLFYI